MNGVRNKRENASLNNRLEIAAATATRVIIEAVLVLMILIRRIPAEVVVICIRRNAFRGRLQKLWQNIVEKNKREEGELDVELELDVDVLTFHITTIIVITTLILVVILTTV